MSYILLLGVRLLTCDCHIISHEPKGKDLVFIIVPFDECTRVVRLIVDINESPQDWTYLYDNTPLVANFQKNTSIRKKLLLVHCMLNQDNNPKYQIRLIVTAAMSLHAEPIVFDSGKIQINVKHLLANLPDIPYLNQTN